MQRHPRKQLASALLAIGAAGALATASANAQIVGSEHDFSGDGWAQNQICLPCHTPHHAMDVVINGYGAGNLWNHDLPAESQLYDLFEDGGQVLRNDALDAYSILCMGCHDGTVALDSYGGNVGSDYMNGGELIGTDLRDDHPVGATGIYPDQPGFNQPDTWPQGMGTLRPMLVNNTEELVVSCATCHEPHRRGGHDKFLRLDNDQSALCLVCHNK